MPYALAAAIVLAVFGTYLLIHKPASSPADSFCYDQLQQILDTARANGDVVVPEFSYDKVSALTCTATTGFLQFEIEGIDVSGKAFHLYQKLGGMAASGADTIYDYCYLSDGAYVSGKRVSGREGVGSEPSCAYDSEFILNPSDTYEFSR